MKQQYILREYPNGAQEFIDTIRCMRKITYHNGDVIWMKEEKVIAVQPHDGHGIVLRYSDDSLIMLDSLSLPKITREAKQHLQRERILQSLKTDPEYYTARLKKVFAKMGIDPEKVQVNSNTVKKFLGISESKEKA
jgi:hypothetical protein